MSYLWMGKRCVAAFRTKAAAHADAGPVQFTDPAVSKKFKFYPFRPRFYNVTGNSAALFGIISYKNSDRLAQRPGSTVVLNDRRPVIKLKESQAIVALRQR